MPVQQRPAPAKRASPARPAATGHAVISARTAGRESALNDWGKLGQMLCVMRGLYADAGAIAEHGPKLTHEVALMGDDNEAIARWLDYLTESGPVMGAFAAGLPLLMQFMANHGRIDAEKLPPEAGIVKPAILEERVKAGMELANSKILLELQAIRKQTADNLKALEGNPS